MTITREVERKEMSVPNLVPNDLCEPVADAIDEVADLISNNGWTQKVEHIRDSEGNDFFCVFGGVNRVAQHSPLYHYILESIGRVLGTSFITGWNDDVTRTEAEVIGLLSDTAALLRGETLD